MPTQVALPINSSSLHLCKLLSTTVSIQAITASCVFRAHITSLDGVIAAKVYHHLYDGVLCFQSQLITLHYEVEEKLEQLFCATFVSDELSNSPEVFLMSSGAFKTEEHVG